MEYAE
ncbi:Protein of unknown function [Lactobacillus helveticus CIRM-BIA 951]